MLVSLMLSASVALIGFADIFNSIDFPEGNVFDDDDGDDVVLGVGSVGNVNVVSAFVVVVVHVNNGAMVVHFFCCWWHCQCDCV